MRGWSGMFSSFYGMASGAKNFFFDVGLADSVRMQVPVLSVGNLTVGGTGKTPLVQKILSRCRDQSLKPIVVSRNYKAESLGIHKVDIHRPQGAGFFGDEAFLIASQYPEFPVWTGPKKFMTAQKAVQFDPCELILVDDGFQHRSLHRDFDLVLLDCTSSPTEEALLPKGLMREGFASLERATAVALTKVNWAEPQRVEELKKKIPSSLETYEVEFHLDFSKPVDPTLRVLTVSGIARPQVFQELLKDHYVHEHLIFPDHHKYRQEDIDRILRLFKQHECQQILTTEKDAVKLGHFPEIREFLNPLAISTLFREEPKGLYAFLDRCHRL